MQLSVPSRARAQGAVPAAIAACSGLWWSVRPVLVQISSVGGAVLALRQGRILYQSRHLLYLHHLDILVLFLVVMVVVHLVVALQADLQTLEQKHWIYSDLLPQNR